MNAKLSRQLPCIYSVTIRDSSMILYTARAVIYHWSNEVLTHTYALVRLLISIVYNAL